MNPFAWLWGIIPRVRLSFPRSSGDSEARRQMEFVLAVAVFILLGVALVTAANWYTHAVWRRFLAPDATPAIAPITIVGADEATMNRWFPFPFLSTWKEDAPESIEEQVRLRTFKLDKNFIKKLPFMARAMLYGMVEYYPHYHREGFWNIPLITDVGTEYWKQNNVYAQFADDRSIVDRARREDGSMDENCSVALNELFMAFIHWVKRSFLGHNLKQFSRTEFGNQMDKLLVPMRDSRFYGVKILEAQAIPPR